MFGQGSQTLRVWDVATGELRLFDLPEGSSTNTGYERGVMDLGFADESTLYSAGDGGVYRWDLMSGAHELVLAATPEAFVAMALAADGQTALVQELEPRNSFRPNSSVKILDLATGTARGLPTFGETGLNGLAIDPSGTVAVSADVEGTIRVGRLSGGAAHLLVGHKGTIASVDISPDLRWIASVGEDGTLRLWPMPDFSKPPLHTLPYDELIAKLKSLTNIRVVRDPDAADGWRVDLDPFPGWEKIPTW
jgi:WD40 repeat protein